MSNYGNAIQNLRKQKNMTQSELGEKLNISSQAVSKWENNLSQPDFDTIRKITELFGISMDDFIALVEEGEITEKPAAVPEQAENPEPEKPAMLGVCSNCGIVVTKENFGVSSPKMLCKTCHDKNEQLKKTERERAVNKVIATQRENRKEFRRSLTVPAIVMGIILIITLIVVIPEKWPTSDYVAGVIGFLCIYLMIPQIVWDRGPVPWLFENTFSRSIRMPGVIFSLSIDGILWALGVKILLFFLGLALSILLTLLGLGLCMVVAPVSFVPCLIGEINDLH